MSSLPRELTGVMHFCPIDQNLLHITDEPMNEDDATAEDESNETGGDETAEDEREDETNVGTTKFRWYCLTCDYTYPIIAPVRIDVPLEPKEEDRIVGGDQAWANAQTTDGVRCEKCGGRTAYYREMQTRSADEPMTQFYRCKNTDCGYMWKSG